MLLRTGKPDYLKVGAFYLPTSRIVAIEANDRAPNEFGQVTRWGSHAARIHLDGPPGQVDLNDAQWAALRAALEEAEVLILVLDGERPGQEMSTTFAS